MATTKQKSRAKTAVGEKNGTPPSIEWQGMTLEISAKAPGYLLFEEEADLTTTTGAMKFIRAIIGEDQYQAVKAKIVDDGLDMEKTRKIVLDSPGCLFEKVAEALGTSAGESSASTSS